jgi:hypothetical protein
VLAAEEWASFKLSTSECLSFAVVEPGRVGSRLCGAHDAHQIDLPIEAFDQDGDNTTFTIVAGNTNNALRFGTPYAAVQGGPINRVYVYICWSL